MKMNVSLLFYLKKPKNHQAAEVPIYLRITVAGQRAELSSGRSCEPGRWNTAAGRSIGTKERVKTLNAYLDTLQLKVHEVHRQLVESGEPFSANTIKDQVTGKSGKAHLLLQVFKEHNLKMAALVGEEYSAGTLERYTTCLNHTRDFLQWKYGVEELDIRKVDHAFLTDFEFYLRSECKCSHNTAVKYIKNFGKIIRVCLANGWLKSNPFAHYKSKVRQVDRSYLTEGELQQLAAKQFASDRLAQVRDIYLFCCFTGLAYIDVKQLRATDIIKGIDGEQWISINRQKTDIPSRIPLLTSAVKIIAKYRGHPQCLHESRVLPVLSNQKMNAYLKEIADVCGIIKPLTFHSARHTFATTVTLLNGVPMESVSKMLGHTNLRTTQHYAKILDIKVGEDMGRLREKFKNKEF